MSDKVAQISELFTQESELPSYIGNLWTTWDNQLALKKKEWAELDSYIFATDTTTTSNRTLPHNHTTTLPKICQIRDNLHSNYMSALFPNDKWLTWTAYTKDAAKHDVAQSITGYMSNKLREGNFRTTVSRLLYDYIDRGNAFTMPSFESRHTDKGGERVQDFIGPKAIRISPNDIRFDPTATDFKRTPKVIRSIKTLGELAKLAQIEDEHSYWSEFLEKRQKIASLSGGINREDFEKAIQFQIDGFGNLHEYFQGQYVEVLEFYGDLYDTHTGELQENMMVTIVDRSFVARKAPVSTYSGRSPINHVGWRLRPDNLWAMGPLDNLIGLQYRLDHLENLKAEAVDFSVYPMKKIIGEVEEFIWKPGGEIHIDEDGDVQELGAFLNGVINAQQEMQMIEDRMELYAGAPREAMGIRTPGEKTAFEFESLMTAAGRIFQEKATNFEINLLEPMLNDMLEIAHRNFSQIEQVGVVDDEFGIQQFIEIDKDSLTAEGVLRPVGARHFAQQQQDLVSLNQLFNGPLGEIIAPHTSGVELTRLIDNVMNLRGYTVFQKGVAVSEQTELARLQQSAQEDLEVEATVQPETTFSDEEEEVIDES